MKKEVNADLLLNPFCMADRDMQVIREICDELNIDLTILNSWEINEDKISFLSDYIQIYISDVRKGVKPGSVYSQLFVNGKRFNLNPNNLSKVKQLIQGMIGESK